MRHVLKQKNDLKGWLEKEIKDCYNYPNTLNFPSKIIKYGFEKRLRALEDVRKELGGKP